MKMENVYACALQQMDAQKYKNNHIMCSLCHFQLSDNVVVADG